MAFDNVSLNKLLKLLPCTLKKREAMIRKDARDAVLKERKAENDDGGDFYAVFWSGAKKFVLKGDNLRKLVREQIRKSKSKRRLYPVLLDGFFRWYGARHEDGDPAARIEIAGTFGRCSTLAKSGAVRVHNLLAWKEPDGTRHIVYPYFDKDHALGPRAARLGRWAMVNALPDHDAENMAILDVLRGQVYDNDNCPLRGDEEEILSERYGRILNEWETQKRLVRLR
jgi:hypothetical protein